MKATKVKVIAAPMTDNILKDWHAGMSYERMHVKYGPWAKCECEACDAARAKAREEEEA